MPSRAAFERLAHMGNHSVRLGGATVARVVELQLELPRALFPDTPAAAWHDNADLLASEFWRPDTDTWRIAVQTWVIEIDGLTVVVDTGLGNDRDRPQSLSATSRTRRCNLSDPTTRARSTWITALRGWPASRC
jgi:hypothetical protein